MTKIQIPYGSTQVEVEIDAEVTALEDGSSGWGSGMETDEVLREALKNPRGTKRLHEIVAAQKGAAIVIVVDDHTRTAPTEIMLTALTEELGKDREADISLLVACGTHTSPSEEDLKWILGKHFGRYPTLIHDCDAKDLVYVGTTSRGTPVMLSSHYVNADIRILTGDITLHYYAGFGGGRKSILPGISARETIKRNHALLVDEHASTANIEQNPVHLDMTEAASFAPPDFVLNIVAAENGQVVDAYAGDMSAVFLKGVEEAKDLFCRVSHDLFEILIVSAGGFPKDRNLYQAAKAIENCYRAVEPGGTLILVAECRDGIGDRFFEDWMNALSSYEAAEKEIKTNFVLGGHKAYYMRKVMKRLDLAIVSALDSARLSQWKIKPYPSVEHALVDLKKDKVKIGIVRKGLDTLIVPTLKRGR